MEILAKSLTLFALLVLTSCASVEKTVSLNPDTIYKRDMIITVDGKTSEGVLVVPVKETHDIHVIAQGDLDLFTFTTCHREETAENASNVTEVRGIFRRKIEKKKEIKLPYRPTPIEKDGGCPVYLGGYEQEKGRHSWGLIDFETPEAVLPATLFCNGKEIQSNGVSICQSRHGLVQGIQFPSVVKVSPNVGCELNTKEADYFEFPIRKGQCVYAFMDKDRKIHRLTTIGYELIPIRN